MKVSLQKMAQILQIAVREDAVGVIGFQVGAEFRQIDARHHRAMAHELARDGGRLRIPAAVAGQKQHKTRRRAAGRIDRHVLEAAVTHVNGVRRSCGESSGSGAAPPSVAPQRAAHADAARQEQSRQTRYRTPLIVHCASSYPAAAASRGGFSGGGSDRRRFRPASRVRRAPASDSVSSRRRSRT